MAKPAVAIRSTRRKAASAAQGRTSRSKKVEAAAPRLTQRAATNPALTDADLEKIWKTYKKTLFKWSGYSKTIKLWGKSWTLELSDLKEAGL